VDAGVPALDNEIAEAVPQGNRIWFQGYQAGSFDGLWVAGPSGAARGTQSGLMSDAVVLGGLVYYHPFDGAVSLWSTDGSTRTPVVDVDPARSSEHILEMAAFRGRLYFNTNPSQGWDLWSSDGTAGGTRRIVNAPNGGFMQGPEMFSGGTKKLYFFEDPDSSSTFPQLWALDPDVKQKAATSTTLTAPAGSTYGKGVSATVKVTSTSGTPSGTVQVKDGATVVRSASLVNGAATIVLPAALKVGAHTLTASYAGSTTHAASTSAARTLTIKAASVLTMALSRTTWHRGDAVTMTGTLTTTPSGTAKTGTIQIRKGTTTVKQVTLDPLKNGVVKTRLPLLPAGSYKLSLRYLGSAKVVAATSAGIAVTVRR
jgi:ELWxxDGT repeat protein